MKSMLSKLLKNSLVLSFTFILGFSSSSFSGDDHPIQIHSDSGIEGIPYDLQLINLLNTQAEFPEFSKVYDIGETVKGRIIRLIEISLPQNDSFSPNNRPSVFISGTTHGNEYLNIADRLPRWFLENRESATGVKSFLNAGGKIFILPILNPDGYEADRRRNNNNIDLNRDFTLVPRNDTRFTQPETKALADFLEGAISRENLDLKVTVDYHCCQGSLLFPWSYDKYRDLSAADLPLFTAVGEKMREHINTRYKYGTSGDVIGYEASGTSKDYYYAKYGAIAFTFEGKYRQEQQNFLKHALWWDSILESISQ